MIIELITTGSELLLGQIVNTNAAYMAASLNKAGFDVVYQTTVGDNRKRMKAVIKQALARADIVITSGGLGPTQGDITKEVCAEVLGRELIYNEACAESIKSYLAQLGKEVVESTMRQAMIPEKADFFLNHNGTAPGVVQEKDGRLLINLPGPPREMKDMLERSLKPYLEDKYGFSAVIVSRVLDTFGIGEAALELRIKDLILEQHNPTLALLARPSGVIIRITAKAADNDQAEQMINVLEKEIRSRVGEFVYAVDDAGMEEVVGSMLLARKLTISCAESCTGGLLSSRLTDVPGSSAYVRGSIVSYDNAVKAELLEVDPQVLESKGAVSDEVAAQMAAGVRKHIGTDVGVGITGIAGPGGGTPLKPIGLVYIAVANGKGVRVCRNLFNGSRREIKYRATQAALDMVRQYIKEID